MFTGEKRLDIERLRIAAVLALDQSRAQTLTTSVFPLKSWLLAS